jgi:hypothetical protein
MWLLIGFLLFAVGVFLVLLLPALWAREIHHQYRGSREVTCPENGQQVAVSFDALHAAVTGLSEKPAFRLANCTRWPERYHCDQDCIPQALRKEPSTRGEVALPKTKKIYHLPVLLAAFAGWYLGAVWHSHHLFRARWAAALGLTPAQVKQIVVWYAPHLLSVAACLLFSYGVAWVLAYRGRKGAWQGIVSALFLWGAVVLATLPAATALPPDLLKIEAAYTLVATLIVGTIVGGLSGKLVAPTLVR